MKKLIYCLSFLLFFTLVYCEINAQDKQNKRELRQIAKKVRKGEIQISQNADTIYLTKYEQVIREVQVPITKIETVFKDTCDKSGFELRHERKVQRQEDRTEINKLLLQNKALTIEAKSLKDSLRIARAMANINRKLIVDTSYQAKRTDRTEARSKVKIQRSEERETLYGMLPYISLALVVFFIVLIVWKLSRIKIPF